jgi:glycosyltransferase involved in cell wall biosynthesis
MFSIIIPIHNEEENIPSLIESLSCQKDKRFRVVFVDNNSTDNSINVINKVSPQLPVENIVITEKKKGQFKAIEAGNNFVRENFSDEFVAILDADSVLETARWSESVNRLISVGNNTAFIFGPIMYQKISGFKNINKLLSINDSLVETLMRDIGWFACGSNSIIRSSFLFKAQNQMGNWKSEKDLHTSFRLLQLGGIVFNPERIITSSRRFLMDKKNIINWGTCYEIFAKSKSSGSDGNPLNSDITNVLSRDILKGRIYKIILRNLLPIVILSKEKEVLNRLIARFPTLVVTTKEFAELRRDFDFTDTKKSLDSMIEELRNIKEVKEIIKQMAFDSICRLKQKRD